MGLEPPFDLSEGLPAVPSASFIGYENAVLLDLATLVTANFVADGAAASAEQPGNLTDGLSGFQ